MADFYLDSQLTSPHTTPDAKWFSKYPNPPINSGPYFLSLLEGVSFGVADGVGGWIESGVDPSLFSQALMYHAHRYSRNAWAGEPEIDPTLDYEEREQIEGWEMTPFECLDLAYQGVLREKSVQAGEFSVNYTMSVLMVQAQVPHVSSA